MKSSSLSTVLSSPYEWKASLLVLLGSILLPLLVHLIPYQGLGPLGARLLPIFLFPLMGVVWFRWEVGALGVLAPLISFVITGQPQGMMLTGLSLQLALFVGVVALLHRQQLLLWFIGPFAYVLSLIVSRSLLQIFAPQWTFPIEVQTALQLAWPGMLILGLLSLRAAFARRTSPAK
ncbi:MAG: hypothetical protein AAF399_30205 [Bacteroidota bacterium]